MLNPELQKRVNIFFEKAGGYGYDLFITSGYRTQEEQDKLYQQGRTTAGNIVTNAKGLPVCESQHCYGIAVDIADRNKGYNLDWNLLKRLAKESGLLWGGDWSSFPDKPHFYINEKDMSDEYRAKDHDYIFVSKSSGRWAFAKAGTHQKELLNKIPYKPFTDNRPLAILIMIDRLKDGEFMQNYVVHVDDLEWNDYKEVRTGTWIA